MYAALPLLVTYPVFRKHFEPQKRPYNAAKQRHDRQHHQRYDEPRALALCHDQSGCRGRRTGAGAELHLLTQ